MFRKHTVMQIVSTVFGLDFKKIVVRLMNLIARQQWRCRHREQTCRNSGGRQEKVGWTERVAEKHTNCHVQNLASGNLLYDPGSSNQVLWFGLLGLTSCLLGFPCSSVSKESACSAGDQGSIPGLGRSPGEGNSNPLPYPCLENLMDRGAWWAAVHGITESGMPEWLRLTYLPTCVC